jgi:creatinine amidohydrolase
VTPEPTSHRLDELTWEEAGAAIDDADLVVLPCGSTEQHSLHLPLSVDSLRAHHLTEDLARAAPDHGLSLLVCPTLRYGYSEHHMSFPGTVSIDADTYAGVVVDVGRSLAEHGAERFAILNCHGGNREPHKLALDRLQREHGLEGYYLMWTDFARERLEERWGDEWGHAGEHETAAIEHYRPDLVRSDRKEPQTRRRELQARQYAYFDEITEQGGLGDPTRSDPEFVAGVIEETNADILEALRADMEASGR